MITLYNVRAIRHDKEYSAVIIKERMARYFVPADEE